jgi:glycerol-3-phosphate dehydrogenase (NAD(P)+)
MHIDAPRQRPKVVVLGVGQMGLVCAAILAPSGGGPDVIATPGRVWIWGHNEAEVGQVAQTRRSRRLPGLVLPESVEVTWKDREALAGADLIVSAVPVQFTREAWERLAVHVPPGVGVVSVAKGIEVGTLLRATQIIADVLRSSGRDDPDAPARPIATLSGPTIATELAQCLPAAMVTASDDAEFAKRVQALFSTSWLRIYTNPDVLGVELAGAVKNVIAIAAGVIDGLQAGNNAKSALLARGLAEIVRLGTAMGANTETFFGIAGLGDLATTCFSPSGRNRSCGEALGKGMGLGEHLARSLHVVEGVETCRAVMRLAQKFRVDMPICAAVHAVLFENLDPIRAIGMLMSREQKAEKVG